MCHAVVSRKTLRRTALSSSVIPPALLRLYKCRAPLAEMGIASPIFQPGSRAMALAKVKEIAASAPIVVFSKTYCSFCKRVKELFAQLEATIKVIELDVESDGPEMQSALLEWTGQRTVPNVFISGKHIGGCDDTVGLNKAGKLVPLLKEAGAISGSTSETTSTA